MLKAIRVFVATPFFLELVRQFLRWFGVWLMTIGVPESVAELTVREDAIAAVVGFCMYAVAETGWAASLWNRFKAWRARRWG